MRSHIRKLLHLIGRERRWSWVFLVFLAMGVGVMELVGALLIFVLLTAITAPESNLAVPIVGDIRNLLPPMSDQDFLVSTAIAIAVFFVIRAGVIMLQSYLQNRLAQNAGVRLAGRLLHGYFWMPYAFHLRRNSTELVRNVQSSVQQIVMLGFIPLVLLASETLLMLGLAVGLLVVATGATLLTVAVMVPTVFLLFKAIKRSIRNAGNLYQETAQQTLQALQEGFQGLRDIKVMGREDFFEWRYAKSRSTMARAMYVRGTLAEIPRVTTETMLVLFIVGFLVVAISTNKPVTDLVATLGTFGYVGIRLIPSLNRIMANANNLQFVFPAVETVAAEIELVAGPMPEPPSHTRIKFEHSLRVRDVSFEYAVGYERVLDNISFSISPGESVGIIGSTGAGKSTLVDIMLGLLEPTAGKVTLDGVSLHSSRRAWQDMIGVVPQTTFLIDDTLRRNIAFGIYDDDIENECLQETLQLAQLDDFVSTLPEGLNTVVGERGVRLSGGQRQRVAIARALYRRPQILFFDEATSALDNVTESKVIEGLDALRGKQTLIMVAHRLTSVSNADRIILLEAGGIADIGTFDELMERSSLFQAMTR